jgi:hypothetical protein
MMISALLWMPLLTACGQNTRTITVEVPVRQPPPPALTALTPAPPVPTADSSSKTKAGYCVDLRAALAACNADKTAIGDLYRRP